MNELYIILEMILLISGIVGCIVPLLPGLPLSLLALIILDQTRVDISSNTMIAISIIVTLITVQDFILPGIATKRFQGTKYGFWGGTIGLFAGFVTPIPGRAIAGAFLGALMGEAINGKTYSKAIKPAIGSVIGVLLGTAGKVLTSIGIAIYYITLVI